MSKLLLASSGLSYLPTFVNAELSSMNMLFIATAGNLDNDVWWIDKDRDVLRKMGFDFKEFDIETASPEEFKACLNNIDVVYIAGGNTFHLLKQLRLTGFDTLLTDFISNGGLYVGASAGALIAGTDIGPIAELDEPEKVEGLESTKGLGLVDIVPVPHYDFQNRKSIADKINEEYGDDFTIVLLTDDQAIVVEDGNYTVVDSPRSELELEWLNNSSEA